MLRNTLLILTTLMLSYTACADLESCLLANRQFNPQAPEICEKALRLPETTVDEKSMIYVTHASYLIALNKFSEAEHNLDVAFNSNPKMLENGTFRYNWLRIKGVFFFTKEDFIKAIPFFKGSKEIAEIMKNTKKMAISYNDLGATYLELHDYSQALQWLQKSLEIYKLDQDNSLISTSLANIAEVYLITENYPKAFENFNHAEKILQSQIQPNGHDNEKHERPLAKIYVSQANLFGILDQYQESISKLQEALNLYRKIGVKGEEIKVLNALGLVYLQQSKIDQSLQFLLQAQKLENALESQDNIELKLNLTHAYMFAKDWKKAESMALEGLKQSRNKKEQVSEASFLEALANIYQNINKFEESLEKLKSLQQLNKEIHKKRYNLSHAQLFNEIENTNEQRKLLALERQQTLDKLKNNNQRVYLSMLSIFLLFIVAFLIFLLIRKKRTKKEILSDKLIHSEQLAILSIKKEKIEQLFYGMDCRLICFDSTGIIHYKSPQEHQLNTNENNKMQESYSDIWTLIFPFLIESERITKDLMLNNNSIWIHQMAYLDDILVCLILEDNKQDSKELNCMANIRKYSELMRELSQFYMHSRNFPIENSDKLNQVIETLKMINSNSVSIPVKTEANFKTDLKRLLVDLMITCQDTWHTTTGKSNLELAEDSGFWLVSIEDGQLRTRTMNKYSTIKTIPNNPRWRQVVKTAHYILSNCDLKSIQRKNLNEKVEAIKKHIKRRAIS